MHYLNYVIIDNNIQIEVCLCCFWSFLTFFTFGHLAFLSKATYNKYVCQKKENNNISVGTVRMFIEPRAKDLQLLGLLIPCIQHRMI